MITRYKDVADILADHRFSNAPSPYAVINKKNSARYFCAKAANNMLPFIDPPEHTALRKVINTSFRHQFAKNLPDLETIATDILATHKQKDTLDLLSHYTSPFSARVISRLVGIPEKDESLIRNWSSWLLYLFTAIPSDEIRSSIDRELSDFRDYLKQLSEDPHPELQKGLLSYILNYNKDMDRDILLDNIMLIIADGIGNLETGIGNVIGTLLSHPGQLNNLINKPQLIEGAIEECLRYEPPALFIGRIAAEDISIHGQTIKKHQAVLLMLAAANRDPEVFENPDQLDIRRKNNQYISFGRSRHSCIGASLARLEIQVAVEQLFKAFPRIKLARKKIEWQHRTGHRWIKSLPVKL